MWNYRFGVLLLVVSGICEPGMWAGPSGSAAAAQQVFVVTRALFLQQGTLMQRCFPGHVPRVFLPPPTSFLQFCGYLWVCTKGTLCCGAQQSPSWLWGVSERRDLKAVIINFCLITRISPGPWGHTRLSGVDAGTCPNYSSNFWYGPCSAVGKRHAGLWQHPLGAANQHILSIVLCSRTPPPTH